MFWLKQYTPPPDRSRHYVKDIGNDIKQNGLKNPVILAMSKKNRIGQRSTG